MWDFKVWNAILDSQNDLVAGVRVHEPWSCAVGRPLETVSVLHASSSEGKNAWRGLQDVGSDVLIETLQTQREHR